LTTSVSAPASNIIHVISLFPEFGGKRWRIRENRTELVILYAAEKRKTRNEFLKDQE